MNHQDNTKMTTLCYIENEGRYLMLLRSKKENDINKGKYIGVGGHVDHGESPEECLVREVREETGLELISFEPRGIVTFLYGKDITEYMFLFTSNQYTGERTDCDEGELVWVEKEKILKLNLWEGDRIFLKMLMENSGFFLLKLIYAEDDSLREAYLNNRKLELPR